MYTFLQTFTGGDKKQFPAGNFLLIKEADSPVTIRIYGPRNQPVAELSDVSTGFLYKTRHRFLRVEVESASSQTVTIIIAEEGEEAELTKEVTGTITEAIPGTGTGVAETTLSASTPFMFAPASSDDLRRVTVQARDTNSVPIYVNFNGAASEGIRLQPGESVEIRNKSAVYCYTSNSAQMVLGFLEGA